MARMAFTSVAARAFFEFGESAAVRRFGGEECLMDLFRGEAASPPDEDLAGLFVPFENRAGANAELAANVNGNGDLALRGQFGVRQGHDLHYHGNGPLAVMHSVR